VANAELTDFIRKVPLFAGLLQSEVDRIALVMHPLQLREGELVCSEGDPGHQFYVIADGEVAVERGGKTVTKLHGGDYFGELALLDRGPRSASVRALGDSKVYVLNEQSFVGVLNEVPALAQKLLASLAARLREAEARASMGGLD
jgi:CRP-like cAMP-binding protein